MMRKAIIIGGAVVAAVVLLAVGVFVGRDLQRTQPQQNPTPAQPGAPGFGLPIGREVRVTALVPKAFQDPGAPRPNMTVKAEQVAATPQPASRSGARTSV